MGIQDREYYREESGLRIDFRKQSIVVSLIMVNAAFFLANMFSDGNWLMNAMASKTEHLTQPLQWWRLLSSGFAHVDIWHLAFNMAGLFFLDKDVEDRMGRNEFLTFYLTTLVLSAAISSLRYYFFVDKGQWPIGGVGASGAVVAVVVLYAFYFPKRRLLLMFVFPVPAWGVAVMFVVYDMLRLRSADNVAHDVHLAGVAVAAAYHLLHVRLTSLLPKSRRNRKPRLRVLRSDKEDGLEREGDRLLEKVHLEGEESLTARERKILHRYSRLVRRKREPGDE